jgi:SAM-dependent methyltransferase
MQETPANGKILEAGCGTARLSILLADSGFDVSAMDDSEEIVDYARSKCISGSMKLEFLCGDILNLSSFFQPGEFDTICHSGVMEHFSDADIVISFQEQRKLSRRLIFNVPNNRTKLTSDHFGDERLMSNAKWVSLIRQAGYNSVKVHGGYDLWTPAHFLLPGVFFNKRLSFWWKWMSRHSIFLCE